MTYNRKKQSKNLIDDWADIRRYNNPAKGLSEKSCKILSSVRYQIKKRGEAILTQEELARLTKRKNHQNRNLVLQLGFVQNIEFFRATTRGEKKYNNVYIFTDNKNTDKILTNPEEYFANLLTENSQQTAKKFTANCEKIHSNSQPLYIYNKKEIKKIIDNHDYQHNQFFYSDFFTGTECVETGDIKINNYKLGKVTVNGLAGEECKVTSHAKTQATEFVEAPIASDYVLGSVTETEGKKRTVTPPIVTKTIETVGKDGNTYQSPYLRDFTFTDRMIEQAISRSNKKHYTPSRVWVIIRNILERKPDKTVFGGRSGAINYLVKAIDGERDYEYEYKYPPSKEERAQSMAEISNMKRIQLEKELVKNEIKWL